MRSLASCVILIAILGLGACKAPGDYPSLAPRAAEAIDPRLPVPATPSPGTVDRATADDLADAVGAARGGSADFNRLARVAERLASAAGPRGSESWVAAQQSLSALVAQHGTTTNAAARIDAVAGDRINDARWLSPATQAAIATAADQVGTINTAQTSTISRLSARLGL